MGDKTWCTENPDNVLGGHATSAKRSSLPAAENAKTATIFAVQIALGIRKSRQAENPDWIRSANNLETGQRRTSTHLVIPVMHLGQILTHDSNATLARRYIPLMLKTATLARCAG